MTIGIFFKFHRFWSVRNLDLVALISFSPGLLLIYHGLVSQSTEATAVASQRLIEIGYLWLFVVGGFFLLRLLLDPIMVRRPLLEPNLSVSGLTFTGISLMIFLMTNVVKSPAERLDTVLSRDPAPAQANPGFSAFYDLAGFSKQTVQPAEKTEPEEYRRELLQSAGAKSAVILGHLAIVIGLTLVGYRHFDNVHTGVAVATLYLLFFYTSQMTAQVDHVVPAAFLTWAVVTYRRPLVSGLCMGVACGLIYYPLFLLPLWLGFYARRGLVRFSAGVLFSLAVMIGGLALSSENTASFFNQLQLMFGWRNPLLVELNGFWKFHDKAYRVPVIVAFVALCLSLAIWPPQKNLGTLLSCSAAVMIATQFWHINHGGLYLAWYLPLLLLTIFRPNLEDRVALTAVRDPRIFRRRSAAAKT